MCAAGVAVLQCQSTGQVNIHEGSCGGLAFNGVYAGLHSSNTPGNLAIGSAWLEDCCCNCDIPECTWRMVKMCCDSARFISCTYDGPDYLCRRTGVYTGYPSTPCGRLVRAQRSVDCYCHWSLWKPGTQCSSSGRNSSSSIR